MWKGLIPNRYLPHGDMLAGEMVRRRGASWREAHARVQGTWRLAIAGAGLVVAFHGVGTGALALRAAGPGAGPVVGLGSGPATVASIAHPATGGRRYLLFLPMLPRDPNRADPPTFSQARGFYDAAFDLALGTDQPETEIFYTLDGSVPSETNGTLYSQPLTIGTTTTVRAVALRSGAEPSRVATATYIVPPLVVRQPRNPPGFPKYWGVYAGAPVDSDYEMDPKVTEDPAYAGTLLDDLKSVPSVSLVMDPADLFGPKGIYANTVETGRDWERPASLEMIDPSGKDVFQIDCGVRIAGQFSRDPNANRKHSFSVHFRSEYGTPKLLEPLFPGSPADEFDAIRLRAGQADSFEYFPGKAQYVHDEWGRRTSAAMGAVAARGVFVHLYINGLYWGLYNVTEEIDQEFAEEHFGGHKDEYDIIEQRVGKGPQVEAGNSAAFDEMMAIDPSTPEGYRRLGEILDIVQYADYTILEIYGANHDWPDNNWIAVRRRVPGGQFRFLVWDIEQMTQLWRVDAEEDISDTAGAAGLQGKLLANPEYRMLFADRVQKHLFGDGALTPRQTAERYREVSSWIERAIVGESARWGDVLPLPATRAQNRGAWDPWLRIHGDDYPQSRNAEWEPERERLIGAFFPIRTGIVVEQFRRRGLFPDVAAPAISVRGHTVHIAAGDGTTLYTLDGTDPRAPGGAVSPAARAYGGALLVTGYAHVRARTLRGDVWSPIAEATVGEPRLVFSELNYHPVAGSDTEFLEIHNPLDASVDLSGAQFEGGVGFVFPEASSIASGAYLVLAADPISFTLAYPDVALAGGYERNLSNGGERLRLMSATGDVLAEARYDDEGMWPVSPDGLGWSLVPRDDNVNDPLPGGWRASAEPGGSPGEADPEPGIPRVAVSESLANSSPPYEDAIEVENLEGVPADLSGWYLSDDRASLESLRKFRIPDGSVVPANGRVVFYEEAFNPAGDPQAFGLSSGGEGVYLSATRDGAPTGAIRGFEFPATDDNASFGRVATSEGVELSVLERPTFGAVSPENVEVFREGKGAANAPPRIGDVVINELMIHPSGDGPEWIELLNRSDHAVALGPMGDDAGWRLAGEAEMAFEAGTTLPAGGYLVVSGVDPSAFRSVVAVPPNAQVVGPYVGSLDNAGGEVRLERPVPSASKPGKPAYTWEDRVAYRTALPWPAAADGQGPSMERRGPARFGSDPESWQALTIGGSPGRPNGTIYTLFLPFALDDPE